MNIQLLSLYGENIIEMLPQMWYESQSSLVKKSFKENQKKFIETEKSLKNEENNLLQKKATLSKEEYEKKTDDLRKRVFEYQNNRRSAESIWKYYNWKK